jgi:hypothetical protein
MYHCKQLQTAGCSGSKQSKFLVKHDDKTVVDAEWLNRQQHHAFEVLKTFCAIVDQGMVRVPRATPATIYTTAENKIEQQI